MFEDIVAKELIRDKCPTNYISILEVIASKSPAPIFGENGAATIFAFAAISKGCFCTTTIPKFLFQISDMCAFALQQSERFIEWVDSNQDTRISQYTQAVNSVDTEHVREKLEQIFSFRHCKFHDRNVDSEAFKFASEIVNKSINALNLHIVLQLTNALAEEILSYDGSSDDKNITQVLNVVFPGVLNHEYRDKGVPLCFYPLFGHLSSKIAQLWCSDIGFYVTSTDAFGHERLRDTVSIRHGAYDMSRSKLVQELFEAVDLSSVESIQKIEILKNLVSLEARAPVSIQDDQICGIWSVSYLRQRLVTETKYMSHKNYLPGQGIVLKLSL